MMNFTSILELDIIKIIKADRIQNLNAGFRDTPLMLLAVFGLYLKSESIERFILVIILVMAMIGWKVVWLFYQEWDRNRSEIVGFEISDNMLLVKRLILWADGIELIEESLPLEGMKVVKRINFNNYPSEKGNYSGTIEFQLGYRKFTYPTRKDDKEIEGVIDYYSNRNKSKINI